jgi:hypothetical protein
MHDSVAGSNTYAGNANLPIGVIGVLQTAIQEIGVPGQKR